MGGDPGDLLSGGVPAGACPSCTLQHVSDPGSHEPRGSEDVIQASSVATGTGRPTGTATGASTEDTRERSELQRTYYILLHTLSYNGLSSILVQTQPPLLDTALEALVRGAAAHVEPATRRTCVQVGFALLDPDIAQEGTLSPAFILS